MRPALRTDSPREKARSEVVRRSSAAPNAVDAIGASAGIVTEGLVFDIPAE